jgi:hypothetical protein
MLSISKSLYPKWFFLVANRLYTNILRDAIIEKNMIVGQVEYRTKICNSVGALAFFGLGDVNSQFQATKIANFVSCRLTGNA